MTTQTEADKDEKLNEVSVDSYIKELPQPKPLEFWIFKRSRYKKTRKRRYCTVDIIKGIIKTKVDQTTNAKVTETIYIEDYKPECSKKLHKKLTKDYSGDYYQLILEPINASTHQPFYFCSSYYDRYELDNRARATGLDESFINPVHVLKEGMNLYRLFKDIRQSLENEDYNTVKLQLIRIPFELRKTTGGKRFWHYKHYPWEEYFNLALKLPQCNDVNKALNTKIKILKEYCRFLEESGITSTSTFWVSVNDKKLKMYENILKLTDGNDTMTLAYYGKALIDYKKDIQNGIDYILKSINNGKMWTILTAGTAQRSIIFKDRELWIAQALYEQDKFIESEKLLFDAIKLYKIERSKYKEQNKFHSLLDKVQAQKQIQIQNKLLQNELNMNNNINLDIININQNKKVEINSVNDEKRNDDKNENEKDDENVCNEAFKEWMKDNNLLKYHNIFKNKNYSDVRLIQFIDQNTLKTEILANTSFDSNIHFKFLLQKIDQLKVNVNGFKEWLKSIKMSKYFDTLENNGIVTKEMMQKNVKSVKMMEDILGNAKDARLLFDGMKD